MEIFVASEASHGYSNGCFFYSRVPTRVRRFGNRASSAGYPDGQVKCSSFQRMVHRDVTTVQHVTRVAYSSMYIKHIINQVVTEPPQK
jgi:hypothetical protein